MLTVYSSDEVSKNNTESKFWVSIDGFVYDLSKFLTFHPAGKNILL